MKKTTAKVTNLAAERISTLKYYQLGAIEPVERTYLRQTEARMLQLDRYHTIGQEYIIPVPYLCQIYHLLNLKHLEVVHGFSLKGLKISKVDRFEATNTGGKIEFQTMLASSINLLRIWRQPTVNVELTLHNPYTIELNIGIYRNQKITVMFNVLPLGETEHKLFIDIYSNVGFAKPILQVLLHVASCLTLFEDMPYLSKLAQQNPHRLVKSAKASKCKTMQLFNRYVDLYGSKWEQTQFVNPVKLKSPSVANVYNIDPHSSSTDPQPA
jgi:hypothetical protein